jgi:hypothetical protein
MTDVKFTLEQAMKAQIGSRDTVVFSLQPWHWMELDGVNTMPWPLYV